MTESRIHPRLSVFRNQLGTIAVDETASLDIRCTVHGEERHNLMDISQSARSAELAMSIRTFMAEHI
jgi:hypothetical protein